MDETRGNDPVQYIEAEQSNGRRTWPQGMPALRLGRRNAFPRVQQQRRATPDVTTAARPPRFLRLIRFLVGLALLGLAWVGILAVVMLAQDLFTQPLTRQHLITHLIFDIAIAGAACLIGVTLLGCLIVGAFCLTLALTSGDWH